MDVLLVLSAQLEGLGLNGREITQQAATEASRTYFMTVVVIVEQRLDRLCVDLPVDAVNLLRDPRSPLVDAARTPQGPAARHGKRGATRPPHRRVLGGQCQSFSFRCSCPYSRIPGRWVNAGRADAARHRCIPPIRLLELPLAVALQNSAAGQAWFPMPMVLRLFAPYGCTAVAFRYLSVCADGDSSHTQAHVVVLARDGGVNQLNPAFRLFDTFSTSSSSDQPPPGAALARGQLTVLAPLPHVAVHVVQAQRGSAGTCPPCTSASGHCR